MVCRMKAEPHYQNTNCDCKENQARKTLLEPDKDQSDEGCQKWQKHIHGEILSQDHPGAGKP